MKGDDRIKKLLITGASGLLGWNICRTVCNGWEVYGTVFTHPVKIEGTKIVQIDLTDDKKLKGLFHEIGPDAVIHTAAAANPDYCQHNRQEAEKINVDIPVHIAGHCSDKKIPFVFTSTDLVFDGLHAPYREEDPVSPVNYYGEQKARAEEGVLSTYPDATVCRMPLMFGDPGPAASSFFQIMLKALRQGTELRLFVDEFRTPISARSAAEGLVLFLNRGEGLIHLGGKERISRYNFGLLMMDVLGIKEAKLRRCKQKDMVMAAARAPDVSLDSSKAFASGFNPLPLREELKVLLER